MRKITILLVALFAVVAGVSAQSQKGDRAVGLNLGYGTEIESLGIGARFMYNFTDRVRIAPEFTYFLPKSQSAVLGINAVSGKFKMWDINVNAHYLVPLQDKFQLYPIVGLIISNVSASASIYDSSLGHVSGSASDTKLGVNLGVGIQYDVTSTVFVNGEVKYSLISDYDQAVISVGLGFKF